SAAPRRQPGDSPAGMIAYRPADMDDQAARAESAPGEASVEMLHDIAEAFNRHDLDAIMAFFTDDAVFESPRGEEPWGTRYEGKESVRDGLAGRFTGIPDVHY